VSCWTIRRHGGIRYAAEDEPCNEVNDDAFENANDAPAGGPIPASPEPVLEPEVDEHEERTMNYYRRLVLDVYNGSTITSIEKLRQTAFTAKLIDAIKILP